MATIRALAGVAAIVALAAGAVLFGAWPLLLHPPTFVPVEALWGFFVVFVVVGLGVTFFAMKRRGSSTLRALSEVCITLVTCAGVTVLALALAATVASP